MTSSPTPPEGRGPADDPIELRFDLSADDLDDFAAEARRAQGGDPEVTPGSRRAARGYLLLTLVLVAIGVAVLAVEPMQRFGTSAILISLALLVLWTGARALGALLASDNPAPARSREEHDDGASFGLGAQTMTLTPVGVMINLEHQDILLRWSGVSDLGCTEKHFYIKRIDRTCFIAPRRAFASLDHLHRTLERSREWHSAFAESESELLSRLCATDDVLCPLCSYNLRGHRAGPCPECGVLIDAGAMLRRSLGQETVGTPPPIDLWTIRPARDRSP